MENLVVYRTYSKNGSIYLTLKVNDFSIPTKNDIQGDKTLNIIFLETEIDEANASMDKKWKKIWIFFR